MGFPINPPRAPLTQPDGSVSPEWYRFFVNIQKIIGGASNPFEDNSFLAAPDPRGVFRDEDSPLLSPPQTLAHSAVTDGDKGDITVTNSGATWTIDVNVVSFAKMQDLTTDRLVGRDTAGTGDPEQISVGGGLEFTGSTSIQTSAFTGDVTKSAGGTALTIASDAVTYDKLQNISATDRLLGRDTAGAGNAEELTVGGGVEFTGSGGIQRSALTGDVTASAGSGATTIANDAVTYPKMQNVSAASKLLGRGDSGSGDVEEITLGANISMTGTTINVSSGTATLGDGDYGDITVSGAGTVMDIDAGAVGTTELAGDAVTYAKMQNVSAASKLLGRGSAGGSGDVEEISLGVGLAMSSTTLSAGAWTLVDTSGAATTGSTWTWSTNVTTVAVTGLGSYNELLIVVRGVTVAASGIRRICVSVDGGSSYYTSSGDYVAIDDTGVENNSTGFQHDTASTSARSMVVQFNLKGPVKAGGKTGARAYTVFVASASDINAIRLDNSAGGNLTAGSLYVFAR